VLAPGCVNVQVAGAGLLVLVGLGVLFSSRV
jgi:hypothetical protein